LEFREPESPVQLEAMYKTALAWVKELFHFLISVINTGIIGSPIVSDVNFSSYLKKMKTR
jgi:hypothetical protein